MEVSRLLKMAIVSVSALALSGCLILPGEFESAMTVRQNGDFSFSYNGQIQLVGLATLLNNEMLKNSSKTADGEGMGE